MSRDYKPRQRSSSNGKGKPFITGLLLGLLLGVGVSAGLAIFIKNGDSPFAAKAPRTEQHVSPDTAVLQEEVPEKPRFDFYTILPGKETPVTDQEIKQKEQAEQAQAETPEQQSDAEAGENYFLQVGAFQTEREADNMKAQLALLGLEAVVQTATIPGKGIWHRVRVGPFSELAQINKSRSELARNGFKADLIKVDANASE
ncbi:MAG TPA: SPOR domain-containing protein [Methylophilaceae bacterium]|nr:SPOR domain-containing protein [Methylophilaceae bacterium]